MANIPEKAKEVLTTIQPTKENLKQGISSAKDMIFGSGHIGEELTRVGKDYLDVPQTVISTPLKAIDDICNKNPLGALQDIAVGVKELTSEGLDIAFSPVRGAAAITATAGRAVGKIATAPIKGAFAVGHIIGDKVRRLAA